METQKITHSQSNLEKEEQSWKNYAPIIQYTAILYYKALAIKTVWYQERNTNRSTEQHREPRNNPIHLRSKEARYTMEKGLSLQ